MVSAGSCVCGVRVMCVGVCGCVRRDGCDGCDECDGCDGCDGCDECDECDGCDKCDGRGKCDECDGVCGVCEVFVGCKGLLGFRDLRRERVD